MLGRDGDIKFWEWINIFGYRGVCINIIMVGDVYYGGCDIDSTPCQATLLRWSQ